MIISFSCKATAALFEDSICSPKWRTFKNVALRKLDYLSAAISLTDLRIPPGNRLEALKGNRDGQHSIRINRQWRICFCWHDGAAHDVEIIDYHD